MFRSKGKMSIEEEMYGEDYQLCEGTQMSEEDQSHTSFEECEDEEEYEYEEDDEEEGNDDDATGISPTVQTINKWAFAIIYTLMFLNLAIIALAMFADMYSRLPS